MHLISLASWFAVVGLASVSCSAQPRLDPGEKLLIGLRTLSDEGSLTDPKRVQELLHLQLTVTKPRQLIPQPANCSNDHSPQSEMLTEYLSEPAWLKTSPEQFSKLKMQTFLDRHPGQSVDPKFVFYKKDITNCSDKFLLKFSQNEELRIDRLYSYVCLDRNLISKMIKSESQFATDGYYFEVYGGLTNDNFSTTLQFIFNDASGCAASARIIEDIEGGYRYRRAQARWRSCKMLSDRDFCAASGPITWGDGHKQDEMEQAAVRSCGTLGAFYEKEPLTGELPPVPSRVRKSSPCPE